ncbi:anastral spindle 1 [Aphomia sociella]
MTTEFEGLKTNEFVRRRKLRLQQVREQSKDIAKKIRQRAKNEKFQHKASLDEKKQKEYLQRQEKLVKKLEHLYAKGINSVGASHKNAAEVRSQESPDKVDLSKQRGREATAELRKKKQEKLDEQQKLLNRKVQAREIANEISREKSTFINKILAKSSTNTIEDTNGKVADVPVPAESNKESNNNDNDKTIDNTLKRADMATQWDFDAVPNEWESNIPTLSLHRDDRDSTKESFNNNVESKSDKSRRLDLFALSDEMPLSLRGGLTHVSEERIPVKPSLTLVSEYLQNRGLNLRDTDSGPILKKPTDLNSIKQTILRTRASKTEAKRKNIEKASTSCSIPSALTKKNSVTVYNHSTRDTRDIPCGNEGLVLPTHHTGEDAYSQAMKEVSNDDSKDKEHQRRLQEMRSKIAMTKHNVEKEYNDTMSFLNSLPKNKGNQPNKVAYMDERRQQMLNKCRQQKLQREFKSIERECRKHSNMNRNSVSPEKNRSKSKSPSGQGDSFEARDFQYSWMPVPESDGNLVVHTIPTTVKEGKSGNTVKFSKVDSYHEYRSRHKHTPPTKDTVGHEKQKKVRETVIIENGSESADSSSVSSDTSSVEDLGLSTSNTKSKDNNQTLTDTERVIIYKILNSRKKERSKKKAKLITDIAKSLSSLNKDANRKGSNDEKVESNNEKNNQASTSKDVENRTSLEHLQEEDDTKHGGPCCCNKRQSRDQQHDEGAGLQWDVSDSARPDRLPTTCVDCKCGCAVSTKGVDKPLMVQQSAIASTSSIKTAANDKANAALPDGSFMKLLDDDGQEAGKFYIGATGFLKDDAYEVTIQLRKKEMMKEGNSKLDEKVIEEKKNVTGQIPSCEEKVNKSSDNLPRNKLVDKKISRTQNDDNSDDHNISKSGSGDSYNEKSDHSNKYCDKGVHTSFQMSYAVPSHVPKLDTVPKPATSAYTQTTFNTPNSRPVFIHMSSSTSTAYMSPPEMVLPKFFRRHQDDTYDSVSPDSPNGGSKKQEHRCKHDNCSCKHCTHSRKHIRDGEHIHYAGKRKCTKFKSQTAPINFESCSTSEIDHVSSHINDKDKDIRKHKCRKCESRTESKVSGKSVNYKNLKNIPANKRSSQNVIMHVSSSAASSYKNVISSRKDSGSNLNPIVKNYIKKLLTLNNEGMKAIEVVNQECSAVTTPGSSIIDVPQNIVSHKQSVENKISLEQIKSTLIQQILGEHANGSDIQNKNTNSINAINHNMNITKKFCPRGSKRRSMHKVKSLNSTDSSKKSENNEPEQKNTNSQKKYAVSVSDSDVGGKDNNLIGKWKNLKPLNNPFPMPSHTTNNNSSDSETIGALYRPQTEASINTSTQTNRDLDSEINYIKLAENKLQNMEKIADLTEKCTQRLSSLAKVLEEVRRNKSSAYSQISTSDSASDSDQKSDKRNNNIFGEAQVQSYDPIVEIQNKSDINTSPPKNTSYEERSEISDSAKYVPFLLDIPKPASSKYPIPLSETIEDLPITDEDIVIKTRGRPPPALSRINLKHGQDYVTPHELSTVVEVDSPMSVKFKNLSSRKDTKCDTLEVSELSENIKENKKEKTMDQKRAIISTTDMDEIGKNSDLLQTDNASKRLTKLSSADTSDDYKIQMMDLKQFNAIMLKPFISIHEYAKQYNVGPLDEGSNLDDIPKDDALNDELSSMQSDGSLPDVIAELLKRKIISEPFKFDTGSNVNSTTISSESTLSVLALSKMRKDKKKSNVVIQEKENLAETSDTMSFSSNPDLENAFKKLGMGWASSTLKKTKERLALSSSSNTSSSSLSQFKLKSFNQQDVPALVTDSVSSILDLSKKPLKGRHTPDNSKNAGQQTSLTNSMTVKEFLTNELAKKITFTNKSNRNDTDEFVSLFETKMPEEMKHSSHMVRDDRSMDSGPSGNRARTSTPVQIYKSMTYRSSSSSNLSNGLFSNVDDLSSVKVTSNSIRNHSTSEKDDLTIPNCSLRTKKGVSDASKSD